MTALRVGLWRGAAAGLLVPLALAGCGQKGPLVLPDKKAPAPTAAPTGGAASAPAS